MVIDKFEDLLEVFSGVRQGTVECPGVCAPKSAVPFPSKDTKIEIVEGRLELKDCDNFVLSDRLAHRGDEFIMWCLERAIPSAKLRVNCTLVFEEPKVNQR
jgi:hypothetical protein